MSYFHLEVLLETLMLRGCRDMTVRKRGPTNTNTEQRKYLIYHISHCVVCSTEIMFKMLRVGELDIRNFVCLKLKVTPKISYCYNVGGWWVIYNGPNYQIIQ